MVVHVIILDVGNGAHKSAGLFALGGAKHPLSNFICLLLLWDLSPGSPGRGFHLGKFNGIWGKRGCSHHFFPPQMLCFLSEGCKWFHPPAAGGWLCGMVLSKYVDPFDCPICKLDIDCGRVHQRKLKTKSQAGFNSQAIVCKNIYAGFIQCLLEDQWKPMWTNWSLVLTWCERVMVLSSSYVKVWIYLNLIVTGFGEFLLLPLKITLASSQYILWYLKYNFIFMLHFLVFACL